MRTLRRITAAGAGIVLVFGLAACGSDEKTVETPEGTVKVDEDEGEVTVDTEEGQVSVGQKLPDDFPEDVPLVEEKIQAATKVEGQGWSVVMQSDRKPKDLTTEAADLLKGAGFTEKSSMDATEEMSVRQYENDAFEIGVTAVSDGSQTVMTYIVRPKS